MVFSEDITCFSCPAVSVILCTLNEEANVAHVIKKIPDWVAEVILIDGHSTDNTVSVAKKALPSIRVLYQPSRGKDEAMKFGFRQATGDIIVTLDADGSTDPNQMPEFITHLLRGYDFSKGSRFLNKAPNMPTHRKIGNKLLTLLTNFLYGTKYTDVCCGYNAFWKKCLTKISFRDNQFDYEPVLCAKIKKANLRVAEIHCNDSGRMSGNSKLPMSTQGLRAVLAILRLRFT